MAVPSSGTLHLSKIEKEQQHDDYNSSAATASNISLRNLSRGQGYNTINTNNPTANRPDGSAPHAMSEYYLYDHDVGACSVVTNEASSVVSGGARLNGNVTSVGAGISSSGFVWSKDNSTPVHGQSLSYTTVTGGTSTGSYYYDLTNRPASTQYWYRAWVTQGVGGSWVYTYGVVKTFTTSSALTSFAHSNGVGKIVILCGYSTYGNTGYHNGSGTYPAVGDIVYSDSSGSTHLADTRYKNNNGSYFLISGNGLVDSVGIC